jgi:DNA-binding CsgD family transcriptional regulator
MLEFVLLAAAEEGPRPFPEPIVEALRRVIPCETLAYRVWNRDRILDRSFAPGSLADRWQVWLRYPSFRDEDPYPSELAGRTGGPAAVSGPAHIGTPLVLTDAVSERRFRQTALYHELMKPFGVQNVMKLFLPRYGDIASAFVLDTSRRNFSEADRAILRRLAPVLSGFQRNARLRFREPAGPDSLRTLTPRERTVLARAAVGETNAEIAHGLYVSESTVRKHLEHIYEKLEVRNRAAAVAAYVRAGRQPEDEFAI